MLILFTLFERKGLLLYQRKQLHPFPLGLVESWIKRKDLPEWEAGIEGSNVNDNELPQSCLFGVHFTLWLNVKPYPIVADLPPKNWSSYNVSPRIRKGDNRQTAQLIWLPTSGS